MAREAMVKAFLDIGKTYDQIQQAYVGYVFGDSTCGQRAVYQLGMTGIPIVNVNNNCATGSTALMFGGAGREHMTKYGTTAQQLAKIAAKNRRHAVDNERSQFRQAATVEEV